MNDNTKSDREVTMLTTFHKAVLATIGGSALLLALVLAAKAPAVGATPLSAFGAGGAAQARGADSGGIAPGVLTTGQATVKVRPDIAVITAGATVQAATAGNAQAQVADRVARILAAAKTLGIADADVQTASYSIQPQYVYDRGETPRIAGYQATQLVTLTLRAVADAGKVLDALVQNDGATNAGITFSLNDAKPSQADARRLAIEEARSKAEAMAKAAGITLGKVISISDQSPIGLPYLRKELGPVGAPAPADTQIPVGDLEIVVQVQVQFAID